MRLLSLRSEQRGVHIDSGAPRSAARTAELSTNQGRLVEIEGEVAVGVEVGIRYSLGRSRTAVLPYGKGYVHCVRTERIVVIDRGSHEKDSRLNFRVTSSQHRLLRSAAALAGSSVSEFVVRPAIERAHRILAAEAVTHIDPDHVSDFEAWLDAPEAVIPEMVRLADAEPFD